MQTVIGFFPIVGLHDQLVEREIGRTTCEKPVEWHEKCPLHNLVMTTFERSDKVEVGVEKIAKNEAKRAHIENIDREKHLVKVTYYGAKENIQKQ
jgi:hypothetical protein